VHATVEISMRVLVIEDERALAEGLRAGLEAEGFAADVVHDGVEGLWMAREHPYDAIVLDLMLPGMNGYRVCAALRDEENWTPILMLTAKDGEYDEAEAFDTGADDYVTKPFSHVALVARIRALIRRGGAERPAELALGDLRFDPGSRRARRGESEIGLTAREASLLEYLLHHPDVVVSKLEVLDHVWDAGFEGDPNIVEVYVGRLRAKLDRPFGRRSIETVRGAGYRLVADGR
jgi:DNA-binding response OmpR family regulator